ncbi:MAG TPA: SDR family oxidoreductase [Candidatus Sabulitectum sp.]|nr:SDR family oxidoreductase [Candidatus Sabulitectum sp.]HPF31485.1 SDR family oxidoreductase [Candidatus Sabulitectum sp.]HPJ28944.1 SDR family oxidoreductase [Candidatus Sabulitectum sp.]HPR22291.1 SDR family oxidoreductase [Candidatus Sabulitectum sp.]
MSKRILITGSRGTLGSMLMKNLPADCSGVDLPETDITLSDSVERAVESFRPDVIINTAAITDVDRCEERPQEAMKLHRDAVGHLVRTGVRLITVSTDQVFRNGRGTPLGEDSSADPANFYARSKLEGESIALSCSSAAVVRTSWLIGEKGMIPRMAGILAGGGTVNAVADQTSCITLAEHLTVALGTLVFDESRTGLYHCVNQGPVTPYHLASRLQAILGRGTVLPVRWKDLSLPAPRPVWSALATMRDLLLPAYEEAFETCVKRIISKTT